MSFSNKTMNFQYVHVEWNGKRRVPVTIDVEYIATFNDWDLEVKCADIESIKIGDSQCLYETLQSIHFELLDEIKTAALNHARDTIQEPESNRDPYRQDIHENYNIQR